MNGVQDEFHDVSATLAREAHRQNLFLETFSAQRGQHVSERGAGLVAIPWPTRSAIMTMPNRCEPQHDHAVQEHGGRCRSLDGLFRPALWLLEAQVAFAVLKCIFDGLEYGILC